MTLSYNKKNNINKIKLKHDGDSEERWRTVIIHLGQKIN